MFSNLKEGDTIYIQEAIMKSPWSHTIAGKFWMPKRVSKVTAKRIVVCGRTYDKVSGKCTDKGRHPSLSLPPAGTDFSKQRHLRNFLVRKLNIISKLTGVTMEMLDESGDLYTAANKVYLAILESEKEKLND